MLHLINGKLRLAQSALDPEKLFRGNEKSLTEYIRHHNIDLQIINYFEEHPDEHVVAMWWKSTHGSVVTVSSSSDVVL